MPGTYRDLARLRAVARDQESYHEEQHRKEFMRRAFKTLKFNGISGDYAEFGVGGPTFGLAYSQSRKHAFHCKLWAFDSFEGLPEHSTDADVHPNWQAGAMKTSVEDFIATCDRNRIPGDAYEIVAGYYEQTLAGHSATQDLALPDDIALAYIDCDLYSSTKTVLAFLAARMKHGMIVAFDDYFCFSERNLSGERRACLEFLRENRHVRFLPFVQFNWHGMSFIVEDAALHDEIERMTPRVT
jgi:hypothetical protein